MTEENKQSEDTVKQPETADESQLTINDLAAMKSIIDIASARGTFKPNEMIIVGQTYNKLTLFLDNVKKQGESK